MRTKINCVDKSIVLFQNPWHSLSARIELRFFYLEGVSSRLRSSVSFFQILQTLSAVFFNMTVSSGVNDSQLRFNPFFFFPPIFPKVMAAT